jgi:hypothetical protein
MKEIQDLVVTAMYKYFSNYNIAFFLGGSRRFQYEKDDSDYDFFVSDDPEKFIKENLEKMGFLENKNDSYPGTVYEFRINDKNLVHIIVLNSDQYKKLNKLHDDIRVNMTVDIATLCYYLKTIEKFSGTRIFNMLKTIK